MPGALPAQRSPLTCALPLHLQPPAGPLRARQLSALQGLELGLEHSLRDGPLSKQVRGAATRRGGPEGVGNPTPPWSRAGMALPEHPTRHLSAFPFPALPARSCWPACA